MGCCILGAIVLSEWIAAWQLFKTYRTAALMVAVVGLITVTIAVTLMIDAGPFINAICSSE